MRTQPLWALVLVAGLTAGRAWAVPAESAALAGEATFLRSASLPGLDFTEIRAMARQPPPAEPSTVPVGTYGPPAASIPLAPLLDAIRGMKTTFRAGDVVVHVFGGRSQNKKNWFVAFAPEGSDEEWRNGRKMLHWALLSRTVHFEIAGRRYASYLQGKVKDRMQSLIVVEPEDKSEPRSSWPLQELSEAAYATGLPVTIAGREYRLHYMRDFNEDDRGEFAGYSGDRSITLTTRLGDKFVGYHWFEREIPGDAILVSTPKLLGADESPVSPLTLGLRLNQAGELEIHVPR